MKEIKQDLLNVSEVKKILRVPLSTLYYLTKIGAIKSLRIGKHIRYRRADIEYYLENGFGRPSLQDTDRAKKPMERREYPRINCALDCRFKVALPEKELNISDGVIKNISAGGLFMHASGLCCVRNDDPVEVEFALAKEGITVLCRVIRMQDNGIAVKYRNISEENKERITRYVG